MKKLIIEKCVECKHYAAAGESRSCSKHSRRLIRNAPIPSFCELEDVRDARFEKFKSKILHEFDMFLKHYEREREREWERRG